MSGSCFRLSTVSGFPLFQAFHCFRLSTVFIFHNSSIYSASATFAERKATIKYTCTLKEGGTCQSWVSCLIRRRTFSLPDNIRPHWSQAGAIVFITFRLHDSIPQEVIRRWESLKQAWLSEEGSLDIGPKSSRRLTRSYNRRSLANSTATREYFLDTCHGSCILRRPELSQIVFDSLLHFDGDRYRMGDFVIMPNHVHLLAAFATEEVMTAQCDSWLHYTAWQINKVLGRKGKIWSQEPFDHLVSQP